MPTASSRVLLCGALFGWAGPAFAQATPPPAPATPPPAPATAPAAPLVPPRLLAPVTPTYPAAALTERLEGLVWVHVRIDEAGVVVDAHPQAGSPEVFQAAAVEAARQLRFAPATQEGAPVAVSTRVSFSFAPPPLPEPVAPPPGEDEGYAEITAEAHRLVAPPRTASEVQVDVDSVAAVPRASAAELLTLAPGVFLTQVGGGGDPEQIFLRGFDAREGQDLDVTLEGIPVNDVGNPHGHGLVDLHFVIPEAVSTMTVVEGPFDPAQGDFAVAGSARFDLGLAEPGPLAKGEAGSFGARRVLLGYRPENNEGTLFAGELSSTEGYGDNRAARHGSLLVRAAGEGELQWFALGGLYASRYDSAGLVRASDVEQGHIGLYDTADPRQGGDGARGFMGLGLRGEDGPYRYEALLFAIDRSMTVRSNFTGFLTDDRRAGESPHDQRGDLLEQRFAAETFGLRTEARRAYEGARTEGTLAAGLYGRMDAVEASSQRLRDRDGAPYRTELDYHLDQVDIAPWLDGEWKPASSLRLRAGLRAESLSYQLLDRCAAKDTWFPGAETDDVNCPDQDRYGPRARASRRGAQGLGFAPRASAEWQFAPELSLAGAYGHGIRSLEATALSEGEEAPFARVRAEELGLIWRHAEGEVPALVRVVGFGTAVDKDLVFDEEQGRNLVAGETQRWGGLLDTALWVGNFNARGSATYTYAVFGDELPPSYAYYNSDRQAGMLVPYVPPWVLRMDATHHWRPGGGETELSHGVGGSYVSPRPLPQSERSEALLTVDLGTQVRRGPVELGLDLTNLLNRDTALAEYNFASYFPEESQAAFPTRVPTRHISPGPPRALTLRLPLRPDAVEAP